MDTLTAPNACNLPSPESDLAAVAVGLRFSSDCAPGIRRTRRDDGTFEYRRDAGGSLSAEELARVESLRIPPAWTDVWICEDERGHLQATGRDAKGRKQYRYHELWRLTRDQTKYEHLVEFGEALPRIRAHVDRDLRRPTLDRRRVLALAVAVLDAALVRVGNAEYVRSNESFGLTTLRDEHAEVSAGRVRLRFRGKSGKELSATIDSARIARALRRTRDLPGHELFQYVDVNGEQRVVESGDVNEYLHDLAGEPVTSKYFRTWGGSLAAAVALSAASSARPTERAVSAAVKEAAAVLGNTPAVSRKSYVHPGILELYRAGDFARVWAEADASEPSREHLRDEERVFLGLLRRLPAEGTADDRLEERLAETIGTIRAKDRSSASADRPG